MFNNCKALNIYPKLHKLHKPWLLAPFAMYDSLMYYTSNCTNNDEWLRMKFCILNVMHGNKIYSLSLSLSSSLLMNNDVYRKSLLFAAN